MFRCRGCGRFEGTRPAPHVNKVMTKKRLLIVAHAPSPNTVALRDAMVRGAAQLELDEIEIVGRGALETGPADVLAAQALILGQTETLGYMRGALKDFFDRIPYPFLEHTTGR